MITKEDIKRNLELVKEGKALDLPLRELNGVFKSKYFHSVDPNNAKRVLEWKKRNPDKVKKWAKKWRKNNRNQYNAFQMYLRYKRNNNLNYIIERCLWILYYHIKYGGKK